MPDVVDAQLQTLEMKDRGVGGQPRWRQFDRGTEFENRNAWHGAEARTGPSSAQGISHFRMKSDAELTSSCPADKSLLTGVPSDKGTQGYCPLGRCTKGRGRMGAGWIRPQKHCSPKIVTFRNPPNQIISTSFALCRASSWHATCQILRNTPRRYRAAITSQHKPT